MDFQPWKPPYTILVNMAVLPLENCRFQKEDMFQLRPPEEQIRETLEKLGKDGALSYPGSLYYQTAKLLTSAPMAPQMEAIKENSSFIYVAVPPHPSASSASARNLRKAEGTAKASRAARSAQRKSGPSPATATR